MTGLAGWLKRHLKVAPRYRLAILAALGNFQEGLAFVSLPAALEALEWTEERGISGRRVLLSLSASHHLPRLTSSDFPECLGIAADLVETSPRYSQLIESLLGRTLVVQDRAAARHLLPEIPPDTRLVTLAGEVFFAAGHIVAPGKPDSLSSPWSSDETAAELQRLGRRIEVAQAALARSEEKKEQAERTHVQFIQGLAARQSRYQDARLQVERAELAHVEAQRKEASLSQDARRLKEAQMKLAHAREELSAKGESLTADQFRLEAELMAATEESGEAGLADELIGAKAHREVAQYSVTAAELQMNELDERLQLLEGDLEAWRDRLDANLALQEEARVASDAAQAGLEQVKAQLASLAERSAMIEGQLGELEGERSKLEADERRGRSAMSLAEQRCSQAQIELARREEEHVSLRRRIHDDFGLVTFEYEEASYGQEPLPLEGLFERLPKVESLEPDLESQVNRLRRQLRRIGAVNPEAQREYETVKQRVEFLIGQVDDLRSAESQIQDVIAELDLLMEREFRKTFEMVATEFSLAFRRLFGGGAARLILTDPVDLNSTGIEIEASLPGRRTQGLAVLSGGERSLVASALIFALLKTSPTPFCVLDEVDAMLDEANVIRFCDILQDLSEKMQFIVITHNRQTVQVSEVVYGVSMQDDSVSKVISLKLEEAHRVIAA